jgi:hypothetical protein
MIEEFGPGDERIGAFAVVGARLGWGTPAEAVSTGARCLVSWRDGQPVARASTELVEGLVGVPGRCGVVGHYEAEDEAAGVELLRHALRGLAGAGAEWVVGPMNGSPWARYRFALPPPAGHESPAPFLGEPQNPPQYPDHFVAAGFRLAAEYESRIVADLAPREGAAALAARLAAGGIRIRHAELERFEEELRAIFDLSARAFAGNAYHRPIRFAAFHELYRPLQPYLDPELIFLASDREGCLAGFLFAFPDPCAGGLPERAVLKTFATVPGRHPGLGTCLADQLHGACARKGYRAVIHALMHVENDSRRISPRFGSRLFRRYALYEWTP